MSLTPKYINCACNKALHEYPLIACFQLFEHDELKTALKKPWIERFLNVESSTVLKKRVRGYSPTFLFG